MLILTYLAKGLYDCARAQHDRRAGEGDSFSNSTLRRLNHSIQSSLDSLLPAPRAYNDTITNELLYEID